MRLRYAVGAACLGCVAALVPAAAESRGVVPRHSGVSASASFGFPIGLYAQTTTTNQLHLGALGAGLEIGTYVSHRTSLVARVQGVTFIVDYPRGRESLFGPETREYATLLLATLQLAVRHWITPRWYAGAGVSMAYVDDIGNSFTDVVPSRGVGVATRVGRRVNWGDGMLLVAELAPSFYKPFFSTVVSLTIGVEWRR